MKRLTIRTNEASISFECESVGDIVRRLAAIEDILGEEYDLKRLQELVESEKEGRRIPPGYSLVKMEFLEELEQQAALRREQDG